MARPPRRTVTLFAIGLLLLDGLLILLLAWFLRNPVMAVMGALLLLLAGGIVLYYRRYLRTLSEVEDVRQSLQGEIAELKRLVAERDRKA